MLFGDQMVPELVGFEGFLDAGFGQMGVGPCAGGVAVEERPVALCLLVMSW